MALKKALCYFRGVIEHYLVREEPTPIVLSFLITGKCNSHCIMCNVWRDEQPVTFSKSQLEEALKQPLFSHVKHVGISGGEPSLCEDLYEQIETLIQQLKQLKSISITSNCINYGYWERNLKRIYNLCSTNGVGFQFNISFDGVEGIHDKIRGTKGNFGFVQDTIKLIKNDKIPCQLQCTINKYNIFHLNKILRFAKKDNADIIFRLASPIARLENQDQMDRIGMSRKEISFFCDFLVSARLQGYTKSPGRKLFYIKLREQLLSDGKRKAPCSFKHNGLVLSPDGQLFYCSRFEKPFSNIEDKNALEIFKNNETFRKCRKDQCINCYHDQSGFWQPYEVIGLFVKPKLIKVRKVAEIFTNLLTISITKTNAASTGNVKSVSIIGMYGGGHVGDAAILGGVITRLLNRYPQINSVTIYSIRKDRTECWVDNMKRLPDKLSIHVVSDEKAFSVALKDSQLLVWAGGPLMEIPVLITRHLKFVKIARHHGARFEMEGIGYGPFNSMYGRFIANKIVKNAAVITARSSLGGNCIEGNVISSPMYDPAFDYLRLLDHQELLLSADKQREIGKLIGDQPFMALNLRPLWNRYGSDNTFNYDAFLNQIVCIVNELGKRNIKTVFFPMNADQFGFSDLEIGYDIEEKAHNVDYYKIWETEPSIEELVYLLRKAKYTLCMRYHAVIFSQSQNLKTIGIDYSLSGKGKVSTLLDEDQCYNLSNFNAKDVLKAFEN